MKIISTQYTLKYKSFEIVLSGCKGKDGIHCKECHSPETWSFEKGTDWNTLIDNITSKIIRNKGMINWVWIYGGEPNDNDLKELEAMLRYIKSKTELPIVLFTRYSIEEVPSFELELCDYIKCGEYNPQLVVENNLQYGIKLATSNQKIYKKGKNY